MLWSFWRVGQGIFLFGMALNYLRTYPFFDFSFVIRPIGRSMEPTVFWSVLYDGRGRERIKQELLPCATQYYYIKMKITLLILLNYSQGSFSMLWYAGGIKPCLPWHNRNLNPSVASLDYSANSILNAIKMAGALLPLPFIVSLPLVIPRWQRYSSTQ